MWAASTYPNHSLVRAAEKVNPGTDGATTWTAGSVTRDGFIRSLIIFETSINEPGQP